MPGGWDVRHQQSHANCVVTQRRVAPALQYRATVAQWKAERAAQRPKVTKLAQNKQLQAYVQDRLAGVMLDVCGKRIVGPNVPWKGRRHGRRADRRWGTSWSPEQISRRLRLDFPG